VVNVKVEIISQAEMDAVALRHAQAQSDAVAAAELADLAAHAVCTAKDNTEPPPPPPGAAK
jgi:hypothetical protein